MKNSYGSRLRKNNKMREKNIEEKNKECLSFKPLY